MQTETADKKAQQNHKNHPECHVTGAGEHVIKNCCNAVRIQTFEFAGQRLEDIGCHPAADRGVKHHQKIVACHTGIALQMPFCTGRLKHMERARRGFLAGAAHRKFHDHDRKTEQDKENKVNKDKRGAAVLSRNIRKTPDITQSYRTAGRNQDKSKPGGKTFSIVHLQLSRNLKKYD